MAVRVLALTTALLCLISSVSEASNASARQSSINRRGIVARYNPTRNASSTDTPMQVGNGNFAFGADITGLQTFQPFAIMASWGWKNDSLPPNRTLDDVLSYRGQSLDFHGRNITYMFGGVSDLQQWLISNPNRVNLARTGLVFRDGADNVVNVTEESLLGKRQTLDLWTGTLVSSFSLEGQEVTVTTVSSQDSDTIGIKVDSPLVANGKLGLFLDFPWNDGSAKFFAPFVGVYNRSELHSTVLTTAQDASHPSTRADISHTLVDSTFITSLGGSAFNITRDSPTAHRYTLLPTRAGDAGPATFSVSISFGLDAPKSVSAFSAVARSSISGWQDFWTSSGFVDLVTGSSDPRADELQRRIILSRYLMRVNEAGDLPPQESGLVNNGWYGKFHLEMVYWHWAHWALWGNTDIFSRAARVYNQFLSTSLDRARLQGFAGARWSKMTDPNGRSAPGDINELLIWQQPHALVFAEYAFRAASTRSDSPSQQRAVLQAWRDVVAATADWMAAFAWWNDTSGMYDIGPPMYVVAEDTDPPVTRNPAFELAYWRLGLGLAEQWFIRLGEPAPDAWTRVRESLAQLPLGPPPSGANATGNGGQVYQVYEGIPADFWHDPEFTNDHPALVGLYGWLPLVEGVDLATARRTMENVWMSWNLSNAWGWDFPMLALASARHGAAANSSLDAEALKSRAVDWLLHPLFPFDDVGMPIGGVRVPTPYFPSAGSLLLAVGAMAAGWAEEAPGGDVAGATGGHAPGFPRDGWNIRVEGLDMAL